MIKEAFLWLTYVYNEHNGPQRTNNREKRTLFVWVNKQFAKERNVLLLQKNDENVWNIMEQWHKKM